MGKMKSVPPSDRTLDIDQNWITVEIAPGTHLDAFLIGKPFGVFVHTVGRSTPCRRVMTCGACSCPLDKPNSPCKPRLVAYCPMRTADRERVVIRVTGRLYAILNQPAMIGAKIRLERLPGERGRLRIVDMPNDACVAMGTWQGRQDVDIYEYLMRLWNDRVLIAWDRGQVAAKQLPEPSATPVPEENDNGLSLKKAKEKLRATLQRIGKEERA